jgi:hypothetical protein
VQSRDASEGIPGVYADGGESSRSLAQPQRSSVVSASAEPDNPSAPKPDFIGDLLSASLAAWRHREDRSQLRRSLLSLLQAMENP